jgi:hypothetical protein
MAGLDEEGRVWVEQLLLARPVDEPALLLRVAERVRESSALVSFNGKSFDLPLLQTRAVMNRLPPFETRPHLDLLHVGRRLHRQRLGRCSLVRLEREVLGFDRGPDIDGIEVPARYHWFLRSGDASGLSAVVSHNFWDVLSMVALVGLYGQERPELDPRDLTGLARTLRRAGVPEEAERAALAACAGGAGGDALRVLAELAKARGDADEAARRFERWCGLRDDPDGRLELAKLYEHKLGRLEDALAWALRGTGEDECARERRLERLERKIRRKMHASNPIADASGIRESSGKRPESGVRRQPGCVTSARPPRSP